MKTKVLIAVASKHSSTYQIGRAIAEELRNASLDVTLIDLGVVSEVSNFEEYNAAIVGSGIYAGSWLPEARNFAAKYEDKLARLPLWLFSSGPLGESDTHPPTDPAKLKTGFSTVMPREHRIFAGKLDPAQLGIAERLIVKVVKAPTGDYRDWQQVRLWAGEIAGALQPAPVES